MSWIAGTTVPRPESMQARCALDYAHKICRRKDSSEDPRPQKVSWPTSVRFLNCTFCDKSCDHHRVHSITCIDACAGTAVPSTPKTSAILFFCERSEGLNADVHARAGVSACLQLLESITHGSRLSGIAAAAAHPRSSYAPVVVLLKDR